MFTAETKLRLARSLLGKDRPIYVQYYVTARCNLACEQCEVIYANADLPEASTEEACAVAENLGRIGVSIVLLTGGEPFARTDLPAIVAAMRRSGIHVRMQTNGLAPRERLEACVAAGANDISISLDSLDPEVQDAINGGFPGSWRRALRAIADVNAVFPADAFAALGCVLAPRNVDHIPDVVRFATEIGWWVSLVPAHTTPPGRPLSFRTFDPSLAFPPELHARVDAVLDEVEALREQGYHVYDSHAYLADMRRFVRGEPLRWRDRNDGVCDAPNLYFAVLPDGRMAVCCDYRLASMVPVGAPDFPGRFFSDALRSEVEGIARGCGGCLFGSFPEISITARHVGPMLRRAMFFGAPRRSRQLVKLEPDALESLAARIRGGARSAVA